MPNVGQTISRHNSQVLRQPEEQDQTPCRGGETNCLVGGQCLTDQVIYRAAVTAKEETDFYTALLTFITSITKNKSR